MTKARDLADLIAAGNPLADGAISVAEISDLTASAAELNQLDNTADLPDIRPSLLLDFANSKTLDPRITFTRGSTATYWDGKTTAKAEENLLKYSQNTTLSPWAGSGTTRTANTTTAPDGTTTANTIEITTEGPYRNVAQSPAGLASTAYTASVYLKKSNWDYVRVNMQSRTSGGGYIGTISSRTINLSDGTTVGTDEGTPTTTNVGNGWYRVTFSGTSAVNAGTIFVDASFADSTGNGAPATNIASGSEFFIWGFQLEQRSSATAYTATTSSPIVKYQPVLQTAASGEARFDHDPVTGESKGLLIEEARTNLLTYSEDFDQWSTPAAPTAATVTDDTIVSPDGNITGATVEFTASDNHPAFINATVSLANGSSMTNSLFIKYGGGNLTSYKLQAFSSGTSNLDGYAVITFNSSGEITSVTTNANVTSVGYEDVGNGWYKVYAVQENTTGGTQTSMRISIGRGASDTGFIYLWGAQVEEGSFPTSYIPTSGSTVTRAQDDAKITGSSFSSFFSNQVGTIYVEHGEVHEGNSVIGERLVTVYPSSNNTVKYNLEGYRAEVRYETAWDAVNFNNETRNGGKVAMAFDDTGFSAASLGVFQGSVTRQPYSQQAGRMFIGSANGNGHTNACIPKVAFYPKRLPNATLQAMTEE